VVRGVGSGRGPRRQPTDPLFHRFNQAFAQLEQGYRRFVVRMVQWRRWVLVALAAGLVVTVMGFRASPQDFIPNTD